MDHESQRFQSDGDASYPSLPRAVQRDVVCPTFWTTDRIPHRPEMNLDPAFDILRALVFPAVANPKNPLQKCSFHRPSSTLFPLYKHTFCGRTGDPNAGKNKKWD
jgi:hypothetical protein